MHNSGDRATWKSRTAAHLPRARVCFWLSPPIDGVTPCGRQVNTILNLWLTRAVRPFSETELSAHCSHTVMGQCISCWQMEGCDESQSDFRSIRVL